MEVNIAERFLDEFMADDDGDREMQKLLWTYEQSNDYDKGVIDNVFIHLCGWSLHTLANAEQSIDEYRPDYKNFVDEDADKRLSNYYKAVSYTHLRAHET